MSPRVLILLFSLLMGSASADAQVVRKGLPKLPKASVGKKARALERYNSMTPDQREKFLQKLPADRRKQFEQNQRNLNKLDDNQKARLQNQYENFQQLPPERQQAARRAFRQMNQMPVERRKVIRGEAARLNRMSESDRQSHLSSEEFKGKYSPEERKMIQDLGSLVPNTVNPQ
jgi:hypothetical protein